MTDQGASHDWLTCEALSRYLNYSSTVFVLLRLINGILLQRIITPATSREHNKAIGKEIQTRLLYIHVTFSEIFYLDCPELMGSPMASEDV